MPWFAGVPREKINWSPTIDSQKCLKCGICMNCGRGVFQWGDDEKPHVVNPNDCVAGCSTCANLCLGNAIQFPPIEELRTFYRKNKVWSAVKKELIEIGKIPSKGGKIELESQIQ